MQWNSEAITAVLLFHSQLHIAVSLSPSAPLCLVCTFIRQVSAPAPSLFLWIFFNSRTPVEFHHFQVALFVKRRLRYEYIYMYTHTYIQTSIYVQKEDRNTSHNLLIKCLRSLSVKSQNVHKICLSCHFPSSFHTFVTHWWERQKSFLSLNVAGFLKCTSKASHNPPSLQRLDTVRHSF